MELARFGEIEEVVVADNIGDHMIGNVYVKFQNEEQAGAAMKGLNGRYYSKRVICAECSPVTDFREAKCRQYSEGQCDRGGYCNFMHPKHVSRDLKKQLFTWMYEEHKDYRKARHERKEKTGERSHSRERERERRPARSRSRER